MTQLMPLPLTISCFSKIQISFNFLVPAQLGSPGKRTVKCVCVCVVSSSKQCVVLYIIAISVKEDNDLYAFAHQADGARDIVFEIFRVSGCVTVCIVRQRHI